MPVQVTYDVRQPETHLVAVTQVFPATNDARRTFRMAAWVPGSYKIRDFGRHVQDVEASVGGKTARVRQDGKDAWTVQGIKGKSVTLQFNAYARELTVDTSHVTADHAHIFPATTTLYDAASRGEPHTVKLLKPRGWGTWTGLESKAFDGKLETADDYDHLIDCPIEMGPSDDYWVRTFSVRNKPHRIVYWKAPDMDGDRIAKDIRAIVTATADLFGGLPYQHYTFMGHVAVDYGGGLEHRNSTVLGIDPLDLQVEKRITTKHHPLVAHEFFHTWNVKRILPKAFQPYDLQVEVYTDLLWLFEGFTTYYELPLLKRAGVADDERFGQIVAEMLKYYEMALGRKRISVAEASRLTWSLLYQPHEHNVNRNVSYYTKGMWVGLCLDHHLRMNGVKDGLDTVMRYLWSNHQDEGVGENDMPAIVKAATGVDVRTKLNGWVNGTTELPIVKAFSDLGWEVTHQHDNPKAPLGLGVQFRPGKAIIERIPEDGPVYSVLQPGDEMVAVEGTKWNGKRFAALANTKAEGDLVRMTVFREGRLRDFDVPLRTMPKDKISVKPRKGNAAATRRRTAWLG